MEKPHYLHSETAELSRQSRQHSVTLQQPNDTPQITIITFILPLLISLLQHDSSKFETKGN